MTAKMPSFFLTEITHDGTFAVTGQKEVILMPTKRRPPPRAARHASPEEKAWLNDILQQLAYDEYMQDQREWWLFLRPPKRDRVDSPPAIL